jgi:hypothetical protein
MSAPLITPASAPALVSRPPILLRGEGGQSLGVWIIIAVLHFTAQIIFRRTLTPGEFGTLNTALGMIGLMALPLVALTQSFAGYLARPASAENNGRVEAIRKAALPVTETFGWAWGAISFVLIFICLPLLDLPRFSLQLFILMNVLVALGAGVSWAVCQSTHQLRLWSWLLISAALGRALLAWGISSHAPWAEAGLAAVLLSGFILLTPALSQENSEWLPRLHAFRTILERDFLIHFAATLCVMTGIFLFINADRIVAQSWFGVATNNNLGLVNWEEFDAYQTAGLLARSLLWGTQPLLWIFFSQRVGLTRTPFRSLSFFWIYLATLLLGVLLMTELARPLSRLFCGANFTSTSELVPSLAATMIPLGLLQVLGIFALASRRHHECFVFGGCGTGYAALLYFAGRQPLLMPAYMFGGGLVCMMIVLFVGVVRWGRKQP